MKNQFKFMPMYWNDYDVDTAHLETAAEHGAYLLLIAHYWRRGQPIPDSDNLLSRLTKQSMENWLEMKPTICGFFDYQDGFWRHEGVEKLFAECRAVSQRGRDNANKRWRSDERSVVVQMPVRKE